MKTLLFLASLTYLHAQTPMPPYGAPISLELAKKVASAAQAEARKNDWGIVVSIVDSGGNLVLLERMDTAQLGSVAVSQDKAKSAVEFRRPTKAFQDNLAAGGEGLRMLKVRGAIPVEGGLPILVDGKVIGGIGISGATSAQDGQIAQAGLAVVAGQ
jgi:glc operon protein GlcG